MATSTNFKVSNGVTTSSVSNLVGLNITNDNALSKSDISYASENLSIKNKSTTGSLILGTNDTTAITIDSSQNVSIAGNLTVNGTTETVNSTVTLLADPIMTLGGTTAPSSNDTKDRGIEFRWHNGTSAKTGFFGYDSSTGYLTFIPDGTNTSEVYSGTMGDIQAANFRGALIGNASTATTLATSRNIALTGDVTGTASFNGSADASITSTLANSGVTAGTYKSVTVDVKGRVTAGTNPTTLSGYGITDAAPIASPTFTGTVSGITKSMVGLGNVDNTSDANKPVSTATQTALDLKSPLASPTFTGTVTTPTITTTATTGLSLTSGSSNVILYNQAGYAAPSFTTRSVGAKIVLFPQMSATTADHAIGIEGGNGYLWCGVPDSSSGFKWYGGTTLAATLTGTGNLTTVGNILGSDIFAQRASSPTTGYVFLGNSSSKYIGFDGTNIIAAGGTNFVTTGSISCSGTLVTYGGLPNFNVGDAAYNVLIQSTAGYAANIALYSPGVVAAKFGVNTAGQFEWGGWTMAAGRMYLDGSGNLTAAGNVTAYSDVRLKTNIKTLSNSLEKTKQLRGVEFDRIDTGSHEIGVIAQEIQKVLPEVVLVGKDEQETLSVDYGKIVGLLIEAIKELNDKVDTLTAKVGA